MREIRIEEGYPYRQEILKLFTEYTDMLIKGDPEFAGYLDIQHYDKETRDLSLKYGRPDGRLYIAFCGDRPAGCAALRKIDNERCEIKRLYVREEYRDRGLGKELMLLIRSEAKKAGYKFLLLDTLPFLEKAISMYRKYGFYEIGCYNDSPIENTIYMMCELDNI